MMALKEPGSVRVANEWRSWLQRGVEIVAPELLWYEVTSSVSKHRKRGDVTDEEAHEALEELLGLEISPLSGLHLHRAAYNLAVQLGHTAAYDAHYIAAAIGTGCALWTSDGGMRDAAEAAGAEVELISGEASA
jgi:predicted nucleic acid-binding protein